MKEPMGGTVSAAKLHDGTCGGAVSLLTWVSLKTAVLLKEAVL